MSSDDLFGALDYLLTDPLEKRGIAGKAREDTVKRCGIVSIAEAISVLYCLN